LQRQGADQAAGVAGRLSAASASAAPSPPDSWPASSGEPLTLRSAFSLSFSSFFFFLASSRWRFSNE
jgi:hypothetical protein